MFISFLNLIDAAEGLKVLRENNLIHRDLKPQVCFDKREEFTLHLHVQFGYIHP